MEKLEFNKKGCVYFFKHVGLTPVKIGYSDSISPIDRFNQFKTYAPFGSEILGFIMCENPLELEKKLHLKYSNKRLNGEWFEITLDEVKNEIEFNSNIEDIKNKNDFEIFYAKNIAKNLRLIREEVEQFKVNDIKETILSILKINPKTNKTFLADKYGVTRVTIYRWLNELK